MKFRRLGKTGLKVSVVGFGGVFIADLGFNRAVEVLNRALDRGVNFIDTARCYGDSEEKIGAVLAERKDECYIATKTESLTAEGAIRDIETSLKALRVDRIDLCQLHNHNTLKDYRKVVGPGGALEGLKRARTEGKIEHIGLAMHRSLKGMKEAIQSQEFETILLAHNPIDPEGAGQIIPLAKEHDMGVIIMKALDGGRLTTPGCEGLLHYETQPKICPLHHDPVVEGSLKFLLSTPGVSTVIIGMATISDAEEDTNIGDAPLEMTEMEKKELYRLIGGLRRVFNYGQVCLHCDHCQPCPEGIRISDVYRAWDIYNGYPKALKAMGPRLIKSLEVKPDQCTECRECEARCPANLPIAIRMKEIAKNICKRKI